MTADSRGRSVLAWLTTVMGVIAAAYASYAAVTWFRFGRAVRAAGGAEDPLLDGFMPIYDIVERHHIRVRAPAAITFAAACQMDLLRSPIVRAIFRSREWLLGSVPDEAERPTGLVAMTKSLGWGVLAEMPGREIVMGAVTRPWEANVTFRSLPPQEFAAFADPGYVKIAWTLRADPRSPNESLFCTETRAIATDGAARQKFRRYWSLLSPGIIAIRWLMLEPLKAEAERLVGQMADVPLNRTGM